MDERKAEDRVRARAARKAIPPGVRREKEARIRASLYALPEMKAAQLVASYVGVHSEVDTRVVIEELLARGTRVAVPVVTPPETMRLAEIGSLGDLSRGAHAIPEPPPPRTFLDDADVLLVPGLAFTRDGHRLGNGGGYFDRLLAAMPGALRVGLAYDEQLARDVPREGHDEPMDVVVTDAGVYRSSRRRS